jgi:DNA-binding response OmpR family regulator
MVRLLIAEDEEHIYRMLEFRFKNAGHQVVWASDGGQALTIAKDQLPDAIVMDVMMPVKDGFQVLRELKADGTTEHIPVIMLTAASQEQDIISGLGSGASDYITKPFRFPELLARLNRVLALKS